MFATRQYIEIKDGNVNRVTETNGIKSYQVLGEATEPNKFELVQMVTEEVKELPKPLKVVIELRPIEDFADNKDALEEHGKLFGIDLNKRKLIKNMYKDLENHIEDGV